jgi:hypothetical protein
MIFIVFELCWVHRSNSSDRDSTRGGRLGASPVFRMVVPKIGVPWYPSSEGCDASIGLGRHEVLGTTAGTSPSSSQELPLLLLLQLLFQRRAALAFPFLVVQKCQIGIKEFVR